MRARVANGSRPRCCASAGCLLRRGGHRPERQLPPLGQEMARAFALVSAGLLGTTEEMDAKGKRYTAFKVRVTTHGGASWVTAKRYSEFSHLEQELHLAGVEVTAKLPKKKLRHTSNGLAKRQEALQTWLAEAVREHGDHGIVVQFLAQPPAELGDGSSTKRLPSPPEFNPLFDFFGELRELKTKAAAASVNAPPAADGGSDVSPQSRSFSAVQQLLGLGRTKEALDITIQSLRSETNAGGPLAVGFCAAGGAVETIALLECAGAMLPLSEDLLARVAPDSPEASVATGALKILVLLSMDNDFRANNRYIYRGLGCSAAMAARIVPTLGRALGCRCDSFLVAGRGVVLNQAVGVLIFTAAWTCQPLHIAAACLVPLYLRCIAMGTPRRRNGRESRAMCPSRDRGTPS